MNSPALAPTIQRTQGALLPSPSPCSGHLPTLPVGLLLQ